MPVCRVLALRCRAGAQQAAGSNSSAVTGGQEAAAVPGWSSPSCISTYHAVLSKQWQTVDLLAPRHTHVAADKQQLLQQQLGWHASRSLLRC
jgi:hypothetical protein